MINRIWMEEYQKNGNSQKKVISVLKRHLQKKNKTFLRQLRNQVYDTCLRQTSFQATLLGISSCETQGRCRYFRSEKSTIFSANSVLIQSGSKKKYTRAMLKLHFI